MTLQGGMLWHPGSRGGCWSSSSQHTAGGKPAPGINCCSWVEYTAGKICVCVLKHIMYTSMCVFGEWQGIICSQSCPTKPGPICFSPELTNSFNQPLNADQTFIASLIYKSPVGFYWDANKKEARMHRCVICTLYSFANQIFIEHHL